MCVLGNSKFNFSLIYEIKDKISTAAHWFSWLYIMILKECILHIWNDVWMWLDDVRSNKIPQCHRSDKGHYEQFWSTHHIHDWRVRNCWLFIKKTYLSCPAKHKNKQQIMICKYTYKNQNVNSLDVTSRYNALCREGRGRRICSLYYFRGHSKTTLTRQGREVLGGMGKYQ